MYQDYRDSRDSQWINSTKSKKVKNMRRNNDPTSDTSTTSSLSPTTTLYSSRDFKISKTNNNWLILYCHIKKVVEYVNISGIF